MPVHLDSHDPEVSLAPGTTKSDITAFLYTNPEYGYRPAEIRDSLDIPHGTATTTLRRLHEDGYIGKTQDGYYHALESREDLHRYVASLDQLDRMFRQPTEERSTPEGTTVETIDEAEVEAEVTELQNDLGK